MYPLFSLISLLLKSFSQRLSRSINALRSPFHFLPDDEKENHNILSPRSFRIDNTPIILKEYDFGAFSLASDRATVCPLMR